MEQVRVLGDFVEERVGDQAYLRIHFSPTSMSLQERWRTNGLSADFVAEYWSTFFPAHGISSLRKQNEAKGAIGYIANELLENMMKFTHKPDEHPVSLELYLDQARFTFYTRNAIAPQAIGPFQAYIQKLLIEDTEALYLQQLERSVLDASKSARLGLLTMINDYDARLAWKLETDPQDSELITVTTMVQLVV